MTMIKANIVGEVYEKIGFSKRQAAEIVETVFETIKETLEKGENVKLSGFGSFVIRDKKTRIGRNPKSGESIKISARRVIIFKPSPIIKTKINMLAGPFSPD